MKQKLYKRLEELERISAAAALQARLNLDFKPEKEKLLAIINAWEQDPRLEQLLAESPPEFLGVKVRELRQELMEKAHYYRQSVLSHHEVRS
jgi:hypothetical protein